MRRVLVVGQTPPPHHGQAVAIRQAVEGPYEKVEVVHLRLAFSRAMDEVGRLRPGKLLHLLAVLGKLLRLGLERRRGRRIDVLYYPPAGPDRVPVWRDMALLIPARRLFPRVLFHFHASGLTTLYPRLSALEKLLFRAAYHRPDGVLRMSPSMEDDGRALEARREWIVPYGMADHGGPFRSGGTDRSGGTRPANPEPVILWLANLYESKGIGVLLEACRRLAAGGAAFRLEVVGAFPSTAVEEDLRGRARAFGLQERTRFHGPLTGEAKWRAYAGADIFCFPSYYEREGMPLVLLEAMQFALPVVATRWRGIQDVVVDGETGMLVPPRDVAATAGALGALLGDPDRARRLGERGREEYLAKYTVEAYLAGLEKAFLEV